jgi:ABC-type dipeptide/oligopeptide/nickel transport system permease subunit
MKTLRLAGLVTASLIALLSLGGSLSARFDYSRQDREHFSAAPSRQHWLGTDALGRDRFARLLHGTRLSISLAPTAAGLSLILALVAGAAPGFMGGATERIAKCAIDLMLAIPWLFLLLMVRAMLPLNTSPMASATITFLMLGLLGWGVPARVLLARAHRLRSSEFVLSARASGVSAQRLLLIHVMPNLWPVLWAQFWISVPLFILAEANLSLLGLGVAEPLPSLGSLLRELETVLTIRGDVSNFAALLVLFLFVGGLQAAFLREEGI